METNDVRHALDRRCARKPLDADAIRADVVRPAGLWRTVEVVARTGSTNADLLARAQRAEGAEGFVLAAEEQTSGRGRMGRSWVSPPRAALTFSVLLRPQAPAARLGWLPLLAGVAVATALREATGVTAVLKWPNDLLAGGAKLGGILAEAAPASGTGGTAVVVGIGINVDTEPDELPPPGPGPGGALAATSLRIAAAARPESSAPFVATAGRPVLLTRILLEIERRYAAWQRADGDPESSGLHAEYARLCATIGREVQVELPGGQTARGEATGVDSDGRLLVRVAETGSVRALAAGDVVHVR